MSQIQRDSEWVQVGKFGAPHGLQGWVRVFSISNQNDQLFQYENWYKLNASGEFVEINLEQLRQQNKNLIAKIADVNDRDQAALLVHTDIWVPRTELNYESNKTDSWYWDDLIGATVYSQQNDTQLGKIKSILETGAHDVLEVEMPNTKNFLIPFVIDKTIIKVDIEQRAVWIDDEYCSFDD